MTNDPASECEHCDGLDYQFRTQRKPIACVSAVGFVRGSPRVYASADSAATAREALGPAASVLASCWGAVLALAVIGHETDSFTGSPKLSRRRGIRRCTPPNPSSTAEVWIRL